MPLYVIKNNIKLMLRNKWLIAIMIAAPIITTALLSSAFEDMMKAYEAPETFNVGYRLDGISEFADYIGIIKQSGKEAGLTFVEFQEGNAEDILKNNNCRSFVEFTEEKYIIYQLDNFKIEGMATEYFMDAFIKNAFFHNLQGTGEEILIPEVPLDFLPSVESKDYYGIIEIVYFLWLCFISFACVLADEKKYGIRKKYDISPVSHMKLYLANMAACILVTICEMSIAIAVVTKMYEIKWGNPLYTLVLLFLTAVGATAFGLFLTYLFDNLAITAVAAFTLTWIAGFFGGTYETYMFSSLSESIKMLSPIYHVNRALVEFSSIGRSNYMGSAVLYLLFLTIFSVLAGVALKKRRKA